MSVLDIHEIKNYLPHRYPFLLIDRVLCITKGESLRALKNVTYNEPFFEGHFPSRPVMPGVLIIEAMAQAGAIMAAHENNAVADDSRAYYLTAVDKARFKKPVEPGDQIVFDIKLVRQVKNMWKCACTAKVDEQVVSSAELMFAFKDV